VRPIQQAANKRLVVTAAHQGPVNSIAAFIAMHEFQALPKHRHGGKRFLLMSIKAVRIPIPHSPVQ
jgi:hypothetical protein